MTTVAVPYTAGSRAAHARRAVQLVVGCVTVGAGLAVLFRCGLGLDPYRSLLAGIGREVGASFGTTNIVVGLLLVALAWWPGGVEPRIGTLGQPVLVGVTLNALLPHLTRLPGAESDRLLIAAAALLITGVGGGLYLGADLGATSFDAFSLAVHRALPGRSFAAVYSLLLLLAVGAAWLVGGPVGIATVAATAALGPVTGAVRRLTRST
jgi:uncharacterized membrane protein YczE